MRCSNRDRISALKKAPSSADLLSCRPIMLTCLSILVLLSSRQHWAHYSMSMQHGATSCSALCMTLTALSISSTHQKILCSLFALTCLNTVQVSNPCMRNGTEFYDQCSIWHLLMCVCHCPVGLGGREMHHISHMQ